MRLNTPGKLNQLGKRMTPVFGRLTAGRKVTGLIELSTAYLNCLIGKGAGAGWDKGEEIAAARLITRREPVVLDLGANKGVWTTEVRNLTGGAGRWLLVEPAAECCVHLRTLPQVEVIEAAVGERPGQAVLYTPGDQSELASLHERRDSMGRAQNLPGGKCVSSTLMKYSRSGGLKWWTWPRWISKGTNCLPCAGRRNP